MKSYNIVDYTYKKVFKDVNRSFLMDWMFIVPSILLPIIFSVSIGFGYSYDDSFFASLLSVVIVNCYLLAPLFIYKVKNKFNKLGYNNVVNSWKLTYIIPIYLFCISMVQSTMMIFVKMIIFAFAFDDPYNSTISFEQFLNRIYFINWIEIFFYLGYGAIFGISFAFFINAFNINKYVLISLVVFLSAYALVFAGPLPYEIHYDEMYFKVLSAISPFKYIYLNGLIATMNHGAFYFEKDVLLPNGQILSSHLDTLLNFTIPFILISICISLSSHFFRWFKKDMINNSICKKTALKKSSIKIFILHYLMLAIFSAILFTGIAFLIIVNNSNNLDLLNKYYIMGSLFVIMGIIAYSILAGIIIKDVYKNKVLFINNQMEKIYNLAI